VAIPAGSSVIPERLPVSEKQFPPPSFTNTMKHYQPSDYTVEVQLGQSGGDEKCSKSTT
jgi:hypothetical protein